MRRVYIRHLGQTAPTLDGAARASDALLRYRPTRYCDPTSGTWREPVGTGGAGNPALTSPPSVSEDCDGVNDRCSATTSVCAPLLPIGSPCDPTTNGCVTYATCDATTSTCVERPAVDAACDPTGAGPSCLGGSCDATTATCSLTPVSGACP
jgi:hypothetical protein